MVKQKSFEWNHVTILRKHDKGMPVVQCKHYVNLFSKNEWFYNIIGAILYSRILQILRMSNTTHITHGSIYVSIYEVNSFSIILPKAFDMQVYGFV